MQANIDQRDIHNAADVDLVVRSFYDGIEADPALGRFFSDVDWSLHLPRMTAFWSSVVLHTGEYRGRPFEPHARLKGLERAHFEAWLGRFSGTVDAHFRGENAERLKEKAEQIAAIFQMKLGLWVGLESETQP